ncbi:MAG: outer membrane protein assembly factor BamA [Sphingomonadaceae bacterium]|nr:outer membrane protein assembly factor BamA [Sphingomonadaceae bacterium]
MIAGPADAQRGGHHRGGGQSSANAVPQGDLGLPQAPTDATNAPLTSPATGTIKTINVVGAQRLEPDTVRSYIKLKPGDPYNREALDQVLKDLYASELFADVQIKDEGNGAITVTVRENPVVNRIVLEGNKRIKADKINPEIKLAPRQIFTRSKVRADVDRILELYRRQGRYAATVEPTMVQLDQNRVDVVFEIHEGDKSKIRRINIIGNHVFSDKTLRAQMATKESGLTHIFSSGTSYDPDRLAYDQQKLRQFYLTNGYADFHVVSAVAELTPDKKDFIITYVVEEGPRYKFGDVELESDIRDFKPDQFSSLIKIKKGDWYNAKTVEDTVDSLNESAGLLGYAFADTEPDFNRNEDKLTMSVTFKVADSPRVYVERVNINGNTHTEDKVIRREMRLTEGDAFNGFAVKRSRDRIQSLGFFQDKLEIEQKPGSSPDRVVLETNLQEKSTGELQLSAGYSSLEKFIVDASITEHNFMGKGQEVRASASWSVYSKSVDLGFTEPYLFDKNLALGFDIFRRDYNSFNYVGDSRNTTYDQTTTGFQIRLGVPITEYWSAAFRYGLSFDNVSLDKNTFYDTDPTTGIFGCDPVIAGRYLCDAVGKRTISSAGYSLVFDNLNNRIRPSKGERFVFSQDFAGLGGNVRYIRSTVQGDKYYSLGGFVLNIHGEGGYIKGLGQDVRLVDRFFLGEPQIRGFDIRGIGPRVTREPLVLQADGVTAVNPLAVQGKNTYTDDAIGGNAYYLGHLELELPLGSGAKELGIRPSIFVDAGANFDVKRPATSTLTVARQIPVKDNKGNQLYYTDSTLTATTTTKSASSVPVTTTIFPFQEVYQGNSPKPRLAVGFGFSWNSPFGPFRVDIAKALLKQPGDDTKLFSFNVGTQF